MDYIWKHANWPHFTYKSEGLQDILYRYASEANALAGRLAGLAEEEKSEALIDLMVTEAIRTSQIEGEHYNRDDVRFSIRNQLGLVSVPGPVQAAPGTSHAAIWVPLFRVAPCWWTRMEELSIITSSPSNAWETAARSRSHTPAFRQRTKRL
jgi:hypothetical protein